MYNEDMDSLYEIVRSTAKDILGISDEVASNYAQIVAGKVTGFFLQFKNIPESLKFRNIEFDGERFIIEWESTSTQAKCPMCGKTSEKENSKHLISEMIQDVGIHGFSLWHKIYRKKYKCTNDHCLKKVFFEEFPGFVEQRYARMTTEFAEQVLGMAVNTSSRSAEKLLQDQGAKINRNTVIRVALRRGAKQIEENFYDKANEVVNVGIDDINLRKGNSSTSCMVVVNLDTGKLLGIARGTTGETAQKVLSMFPNLDIVSRDRGTAMASAATALGKKSVADRFHITDNMHDAIEKTLHEILPKSMYIPVGGSWVCLANDIETGDIMVADMPSSLTEQEIKQRVRMAHLSATEEIKYRNTLRVLELTLQGKHAEEMSEIMGLSVDDVRALRKGIRETISDIERKIDEFVANPHGIVNKQKSVPRKAEHSSESKVEPYRDIVIAMRKEGNGHMSIYNEICKLGFTGSHSTVDNYIIKIERENSVYREVMDERSITNDYLIPFPERPERISVRIYSVKTVYNRVLAKIKECRCANTDDKQDTDGKQILGNEPSEHASSKKKAVLFP